MAEQDAAPPPFKPVSIGRAKGIRPIDPIEKMYTEPQGLMGLLPMAGAIDAGEPTLRSLGKPIQELLDLILTPTTTGTGLPKRLRLTNWNARTGNVEFHGFPTRQGVERFEATPTQLDTLIKGKALDVEQPPATAVARIRKKLAALLDGEE